MLLVARRRYQILNKKVEQFIPDWHLTFLCDTENQPLCIISVTDVIITDDKVKIAQNFLLLSNQVHGVPVYFRMMTQKQRSVRLNFMT